MTFGEKGGIEECKAEGRESGVIIYIQANPQTRNFVFLSSEGNMLPTKPGGLSLIPGAHSMERINFKKLYSDLHMHTVAHVYTCIHTMK